MDILRILPNNTKKQRLVLRNLASPVCSCNINMGGYDVPEGVEIRGRFDDEFARILTREALQFVADLQREFRDRIRYAMECRREAQRQYNTGKLPGFDPATRDVREGDWVCAPPPPAIADRKVEITGPVDRKMVINALNSPAKVFMVCLTLIYFFFNFRVFKSNDKSHVWVTSPAMKFIETFGDKCHLVWI